MLKTYFDSLTPRDAKAPRKLKHPSSSDKLRSLIDTLKGQPDAQAGGACQMTALPVMVRQGRPFDLPAFAG